MNTDNNTHEYYIHLKESELLMNTHEVRVSLETAKILQKAGFDWECEYAFTPTTEMGDKAYRYNQGKSHNYNNKESYPFEIYSAPTLDVAQRWLREVKGLIVQIDFLRHNKWWYLVLQGERVETLENPRVKFDTYEQAQEAGIQKCLDVETKMLESNPHCEHDN